MAGLPRWTHIALRVRDIDASIGFYEAHTPLRLLTRRTDGDGYAAWLGHTDSTESPFILVLIQFFEGRDPYAATSTAQLGPFSHLGIELATRDDVDAIAAVARAGGFLRSEPVELPPPVGYVCMAHDPDGNTVEFSYGQDVIGFVRNHLGAD